MGTKKKANGKPPEPEGFSVAVTHTCPYAKGSEGVVLITPFVLANLADCVWDKDEWMAFLLGERRDNGYTYFVDNIIAPKGQKRYKSDVKFDKVPIPEGTIGVVHSHNGAYSANFSGTDADDINKKFLLSIVIAQGMKSPMENWLGFSYSAVGKARMPCGAPGEIDFVIVPDGVEDWPVKVEASSAVGAYTSLGDCAKATIDASRSTKYFQYDVAACGLQDTKGHAVKRIFGEDPGLWETLPPALEYEKKTPAQPYQKPINWNTPVAYYPPINGFDERPEVQKALEELNNNPNVTVYLNRKEG